MGYNLSHVFLLLFTRMPSEPSATNKEWPFLSTFIDVIFAVGILDNDVFVYTLDLKIYI